MVRSRTQQNALQLFNSCVDAQLIMKLIIMASRDNRETARDSELICIKRCPSLAKRTYFFDGRMLWRRGLQKKWQNVSCLKKPAWLISTDWQCILWLNELSGDVKPVPRFAKGFTSRTRRHHFTHGLRALGSKGAELDQNSCFTCQFTALHWWKMQQRGVAAACLSDRNITLAAHTL